MLTYAQELRITARAKIEVASGYRDEVRLKWEVIHRFEKEARDLLKLADIQEDVNV